MAWRGEAQSTDCSNVLCCTVASVKWVWSTALPGDRDPTQVRKYFLTCKSLKKSLHNVFKTKLVILFAYIPEIPKCGLTQAFKSHSLLRWNPALQISVPKFEKLLRSENWLLQLSLYTSWLQQVLQVKLHFCQAVSEIMDAMMYSERKKTDSWLWHLQISARGWVNTLEMWELLSWSRWPE